MYPSSTTQPRDLLRSEDLGTESPRLSQSPAGQVAPGQPRGKPKVVLDARAHARLPSGSFGLDQQRAEPLRGPVHGRGQPGRARPHDHEVVVGELCLLGHADAGRNLRDRGSLDDSAVGEHHQRQACALPRGLHYRSGLIGDFDVEPLVGDLVAPEEVLKLMRGRRPAVAHDAHPLEWRPKRGQPVVQQVVEDRVEALLRRVPRLEQVVVDLDIVDGVDGRFGVGVGRQQHSFDCGEQLQGTPYELHAAHAWHPLIDQQENHGVAPDLQLSKSLQRAFTGFGGEDAELVRVVVAEVTLDGVKHPHLIVHGNDDWVPHKSPLEPHSGLPGKGQQNLARQGHCARH